MSGIKDYSTTPADNDAAPPNGFPEGMAPASVNDGMRQVMADIRSWYEDPAWIDFGDVPTQTGGTTFTVPTDLTARYAVGARVRMIGTTPFTLYGTISASSYSAPNTTVTVTMDSGTLDSTLNAVAVNIASLGSSGITITGANNTFTGDNTFDGGVEINGSLSGDSIDNQTCQGRITLTTGVPVLTSDVTAATTVYFTPFKGNKIALYTSSVWTLYTFTERSITVPATTNTMYDLFVYDNAGTLTLDATAWSSDTARATALVLQDGIFVKSGATNRRYVGSFRTTAVSGQTQVRFGGTATGGSEAWIGIWNYYNRLPIEGVISDDTNTWNYTTATWRSANASNTMRYSAVVGVAEDVFGAQYSAAVQNTNVGVNMAAGVGYDVTNAPDGIFGVITSPASTYTNSAFAQTNKRPLGFHFFQALEYSAATGLSTWVGDAGVSFIKTGLSYKGSF